MAEEQFKIPDFTPEPAGMPIPQAVPDHVHDGVDSPRVSYNDLKNLPTNPIELLHASSGTSTTNSDNSLDTVAITGLTAKDTLHVIVTASAITNNGGALYLTNTTDNITMISMVNGTVLNSDMVMADVKMAQEQQASTAVSSVSMSNLVNTGTGSNTFNGYVNVSSQVVTTPWTGTWNLALRHGVSTAGMVLRWTWKVFVLRGQ